MGIALVQPCHSKMSHNAHAHGSGKEQHRVDEHLAQTRAGAGACAQHAGEDYDADDIINDGALTMVVPRKLFRWPSSCRVATVMDTLVAVMIVPMNRAR